MVLLNALSKAVVKALLAAPCSLRALAREAAVPHVTLVLIKSGKRSATPLVASRVASALWSWGQRCSKAAERLEGSITHARRNE
jgi:hypothetical protein